MKFIDTVLNGLVRLYLLCYHSICVKKVEIEVKTVECRHKITDLFKKEKQSLVLSVLPAIVLFKDISCYHIPLFDVDHITGIGINRFQTCSSIRIGFSLLVTTYLQFGPLYSSYTSWRVSPGSFSTVCQFGCC